MLSLWRLCLKRLPIACFCFVFAGTSIAQAQNNITNAPIIIWPPSAWANQPWTGDNRPYHAARVQIDKLKAQRKLSLNAIEDYGSGLFGIVVDPLGLVVLMHKQQQANLMHPPAFAEPERLTYKPR